MKVLWSQNALEQLRGIHGYLAKTSPVYARRTVDRLTSRSKLLAQFPRSGRVVPEFGSDDIREVIEGAYRIIYQVGDDHVDVAAVIHTAQDPPWR